MPTTVVPLPQNVILTLPQTKGDKGDKGDQGIQGIQGLSGQAANWRGTWSSAAIYSLNDGVFYNGNSYISLTANTNKPPDTNPGSWQLVALQGNTGATGATGSVGPAGVDAFTTTTSGFTIPTVGATVQVPVANASWIILGQFVWVAGAGGSGNGGSFQVTAKSGLLITLFNPSQPAAIGAPVPGATIASGAGVSPGGSQGVTGLQGDSLPIGSVYMYCSSTAPLGSLLCDGASYSTSTYPALFGVIGYSFGGSGGTFNVPDLRSRFVVGAGTGTGLSARTIGAKGGEESHVITAAEMAAHTHTGVNHTHGFTGVDHLHYCPGVDHLHSDDHAHSWPVQGSHSHSVTIYGTFSGISGGGGGCYIGCSGGTGFGTSAANTPAGNTYTKGQTGYGGTTAAADRSLAFWSGAADRSLASATAGADRDLTTGAVGSNTAHQNMPPFIVLSFMVKATVTAMF
jgi:microcystin-dependent protein